LSASSLNEALAADWPRCGRSAFLGYVAHEFARVWFGSDAERLGSYPAVEIRGSVADAAPDANTGRPAGFPTPVVKRARVQVQIGSGFFKGQQR
jgi:hypothetical protein